MKPPLQSIFKMALAFGLLSLIALAEGIRLAESEARPQSGPVIQMATPPGTKPQSLPQGEKRENSPLSVDTQANTPGYMRYEPYNAFPRELDLWLLESARFIRSIPVISPDKSEFAYSEVLFVPNIRQTISKMYLVPVAAPPVKVQPHLPSEDIGHAPSVGVSPQVDQDRYNPEKTTKQRVALVKVGYNHVKPFDFRTLTVTDWSASGRRLLFKERSGVLHVGLRVTDILVYDEEKGTVTIYPEVQRVIKNYWMTRGNQPNMESLVWEIQPLGWEPTSDSNVLLKAWAYDKKEKKFLGLWRYDMDAERTTLLQLQDDPIAVAANGWIAKPIPIPPAQDPPAWKKRLRHPFQHNSQTAPGP
jgi:hypothetical protein